MKTTRRSTHALPLAAGRSGWHESPWKIVTHAVGAALATLAVIALLALVVVPRILGGDSLTVLSGSMEPTFAPGDVVVVKGIAEADVCTDISVGDIVSYLPEPNDPTLITHRVIGKTVGTFDDGTNCRIITQGDANSSVDEPVSPEQIRGVFMYGIPQLGWARQWVGNNTQVLFFAAAGVLVAWGLWSAFRRPRTTVSVIPGAQSGSNPPVATAHSQATDATASALLDERAAFEQQLRERELALRERELELRERELAHAVQQTQATHLDFELFSTALSDAESRPDHATAQ